MRLSWLTAALCLAASSATGQQREGFAWTLNDETAPSSPAQASSNGFGVMMMVTDDPQGFMKAWAGSTPPNVSVTDTVTLGKPVGAMLIFSGCRAAADGNCDVSAELSITRPDGKPYGETLKGPIWNGPPGDQFLLQLGVSGLGFRLEPQDPLGTYTLNATVTDHVARNTLFVKQAVTAARE